MCLTKTLTRQNLRRRIPAGMLTGRSCSRRPEARNCKSWPTGPHPLAALNSGRLQKPVPPSECSAGRRKSAKCCRRRNSDRCSSDLAKLGPNFAVHKGLVEAGPNSLVKNRVQQCSLRATHWCRRFGRSASNMVKTSRSLSEPSRNLRAEPNLESNWPMLGRPRAKLLADCDRSWVEPSPDFTEPGPIPFKLGSDPIPRWPVHSRHRKRSLTSESSCIDARRPQLTVGCKERSEPCASARCAKALRDLRRPSEDFQSPLGSSFQDLPMPLEVFQDLSSMPKPFQGHPVPLNRLPRLARMLGTPSADLARVLQGLANKRPAQDCGMAPK